MADERADRTAPHPVTGSGAAARGASRAGWTGRLGRCVAAGIVLAAAIGMGPARAAEPEGRLKSKLEAALQGYLTTYGKAEHISGLSAFVSRGDGDRGISAAVGTTAWGGRGVPIGPDTLFEIGSNTKAFTSVMLLKLEAEGKLGLDDTLGKWLPQYPAWKHVTIRRLLHMTSGLPTYSEAPRFMRHQAADMYRHYTPKELIAYAYPSEQSSLPGNKGWFYSNTNYVLGGMIVEKARKAAYEDVIAEEIFKPVGLNRTFYADRKLPNAVLDQMAGGYFDNPVCSLYTPGCKVGQLQPLVGKNMRRADLSWAGAAGGIVSTPKDLTRWVRALFGGRVLPKKQMRELTQLVSSATGKPISETTAKNPRGFGLGIAQGYDPKMGRYWFYEGETLAYRAIFSYYPADDLVITVFLNSQPSKDDIGVLMGELYGIFAK